MLINTCLRLPELPPLLTLLADLASYGSYNILDSCKTHYKRLAIPHLKELTHTMYTLV